MRKNVDPKLWGPYAWQFLSDCALSVDEESYPNYKVLIKLLPELLPCEKCRGHCREYLDTHPLPQFKGIHAWLSDFRKHVKTENNYLQGKVQESTRLILQMAGAVILLLLAVLVLRFTYF